MRVFGLLAAAAVLAISAFAQSEAPVHARSTEATQPRPLPGGAGTLWMNPLAWNWVQSGRDDTVVFIHTNGAVQARAIVSQPAKPTDEMLVATLERVRRLDPKARLLFEEPRTVNGEPMLCAQIVVHEGDPHKETVFYGYLHQGEERSTELFAIAPRAALGELYIELTALLDG